MWLAQGSEMAGKLKLKKWDSAAHLKTEADIARYWDACLEEGRDAVGLLKDGTPPLQKHAPLPASA